MEYRRLGRTGLRVSVMALGCGGPSRLGLSTGRTTAQSAAVVQAALDAGVSFIDTATAYRTEPLVAAGLRGRRRDQVVLSSKRGLRADRADGGDRLLTGAELEAAVEASLRRLHTDYIDVYHLHGVSAEQYPHAREGDGARAATPPGRPARYAFSASPSDSATIPSTACCATSSTTACST